jgi:hypothetical protein
VSGRAFGGSPNGRVRSNMPVMDPAVASKLPGIRGRSQLSSTKRVIDDWSVSVWSTSLPAE